MEFREQASLLVSSFCEKAYNEEYFEKIKRVEWIDKKCSPQKKLYGRNIKAPVVLLFTGGTLPSFCDNLKTSKEESFHCLDVRKCIL